MQGLLAMSACHMAASATYPEAKKLHCEYEAIYASESRLQAGQSVADENVERMGDYVRCLLHLAETALQETLPDRAGSPLEERFIVVSLSRFLHPDSTIIGFPTLSGEEEEAAENDDLAEGPLRGLRTLRTRMFELLRRPTNVSDALTILKSVELLQETCTRFGSEDSIESCWSAAASWLKDVPHHFHEMADDQDPVALLVMTNWSAILTSRIERLGCWFLKGVAKASVVQIAEKLVAEKHPLMPLIMDFEGN
jgi:hypothetical protein